ncbi:MFS transporter [Actinospica sp. MGRD01-02]|uniref:MFS transporter n=1 Tax=Actinospica acidithermotolerans TaxID=2828514 RepID=A0A941ED47_9ACTN|nr:MFS transporter [Actinospica acidithermotolerans]MBR7829112.1 MFS transporter [Actinospica acidithermotolerans]
MLTTAEASQSEKLDRRPALFVCLVGGFMTLLDVSIVNVALPSIRSGLNASADDLQWVLSGYALAFGLVLVPAGRLGDAHGRRLMFMVGLASFTLTSALAGVATGALWLIAARFAQGLASGTLSPQVAGLIQQLYRGAARGRAFGLLGAAIGISTAVGPLLGGLLIAAGGTADGWRWVFYVNVPIGLIALPAAWRLLPSQSERDEDEVRDAPKGLDAVGIALLGSAVVLLLVPLVEAQQWSGWFKWLLIPVAFLLFAAFTAWERRQQEPAVNLRLFSRRSFSLGTALALAYFAGFTALFFIFTLYLQNGLGRSALIAGLAITPFAVGSAGAAAVGGRLVERAGRPLVAIGLVAVVVGLGGTLIAARAVAGPDVGWATAAPLLLAGIGSGLVIAPNQTITLSEVPVREASTAAGVLQTSQRIGSAIGVAAVGVVFFAALPGGGASAGSSGSGSRQPGTGAAQTWSTAFERGLTVIIVLVGVALLIALADVIAERREHPHRSESDRPNGR